jgi:hypothetical protein
VVGDQREGKRVLDTHDRAPVALQAVKVAPGAQPFALK